MCQSINSSILYFLSNMCSFMHSKIAIIWKGFTTLITIIWFFSRMFSFMMMKMMMTCKGCIHRGSLQYVFFHDFKMSATCKCFTTLLLQKVFLHYVFYISGGDCYMQTLYRIDYIPKASLLCVSFYVFLDYCDIQRLYYLGYIHRVSLLCVFFCGFADCCIMQNARVQPWVRSEEGQMQEQQGRKSQAQDPEGFYVLIDWQSRCFFIYIELSRWG